MMSNTHSDTARKVFGFASESLFDIIPESCSESSRNAVRLYPGIVFALPRIPHRQGGIVVRSKVIGTVVSKKDF